MLSPELTSIDREKTPVEIERKFLVGELPANLSDYEHHDIEQGYLAIDTNGTEARLRRKGDLFFLTIKTVGELSRTEREVYLTSEQFNKLWPETKNRRIEKTRFQIPHESSTIELDVYGGNLRGLVTAEVEFEDEAKAHSFVLPYWLSAVDVTYEKEFKNQHLAINGLPKLDNSFSMDLH